MWYLTYIKISPLFLSQDKDKQVVEKRRMWSSKKLGKDVHHLVSVSQRQRTVRLASQEPPQDFCYNLSKNNLYSQIVFKTNPKQSAVWRVSLIKFHIKFWNTTILKQEINPGFVLLPLPTGCPFFSTKKKKKKRQKKEEKDMIKIPKLRGVEGRRNLIFEWSNWLLMKKVFKKPYKYFCWGDDNTHTIQSYKTIAVPLLYGLN